MFTYHQAISSVLDSYPEVTFALLFGSRARGDYDDNSDWDIAVWINEPDSLNRLGIIEEYRHQISACLGIRDMDLDIVDLRRASLAIRDTVADEGSVLKGEDSIDLLKFYQRTWALVEDFEWRFEHET